MEEFCNHYSNLPPNCIPIGIVFIMLRCLWIMRHNCIHLSPSQKIITLSMNMAISNKPLPCSVLRDFASHIHCFCHFQMSSSFVKDCSDVSAPGNANSGKTVIIIVNNETGNVSLDGDELQNLLGEGTTRPPLHLE